MSPPPLWGGATGGEACCVLAPALCHEAGSPAAPGSAAASRLTLIGCLRGTLVSAE